jgi:DHA1 family bicyclomycin/chloramphenicol resistance-like MFS transporter
MKNGTPVKLNSIGQRYYSSGLVITYLAMLSAFPALSTDLYLPALPSMAKLFDVSESLTNLTLIVFFITYSVMSLIWGPISDKIGRRPILIIGGGLYFSACILCAVSTNVYMLIAARILQAAGGAAGTAMGTAIVKDVYHAAKREFVLSMVQSMNVICPTVAPIIGAFMLSFTNWHGIFWVQAAFGAIVFIGALFFTECIPEKLNVSIPASMFRLWVVLKNKNFFILLLVFTTLNASGMAFIGASSYVYVDFYGLSPQKYSFFFAFNALCMMGGPFIYMALSKRIRRSKIITTCLAIGVLSGAAVMLLANQGPFLFALTIVPSFIASSCIKPPGTFLMLEQQKGDTGSASSLMMSGFMVMGTFGIACASIEVWDFPHLVGLITIIASIFSLAVWIPWSRKNSADN